MISSSNLTNILYTNNCSSLSTNYNPCCTIDIFNSTYYGSRILNQFRNTCCDANCTLDLNECDNCTDSSPVCELDFSHYMETDIASLTTRISTINDTIFAIMSVSLEHQRMFSGLQLKYDTDYEVISHSVFANLTNTDGIFIPNIIYDKFNRTVHRNNSVVVILNHFLSSGDILYMNLRNGSYFDITSFVVANDRFPYRSYLH